MTSNKIVRYYENTPVDFYLDETGKAWITTKSIALGLEIARSNVSAIYTNNKELLSPYSTEMDIVSVEGGVEKSRSMRVYDKTGLLGVCLRSTSIKAVPFQKTVLGIMGEIERKGYYVDESGMNEDEMAIREMELLLDLRKKHWAVKQKVIKSEKEIVAMHLELDDTKKVIDKHITDHGITEAHMKTIRDLIHNTKEIMNISIWHELHQKFKFSKLARISDDKAIAIIEYIKNRYGY